MMRLPSTYRSRKVGATHKRLGSHAAFTREPCELHPRAERFGDAPGLRDAAARRKRPCCVEHLADRTNARFVEVGYEAFELGKKIGDFIVSGLGGAGRPGAGRTDRVRP